MTDTAAKPADRSQAASQFLAFLTANSFGYFHLWRLDSKTTFWHKSNQIEICSKKVVASAGDIYVGVGLSDRMFSGNERLREDTAIGRMAIVADLDCKAEGFTDKETALEFAHSISLRPSVLVDSGGGIQCWWVFDQPWVFEDADDKALCASYAQGWHEYLVRKAAKYGAKLDSVFDITRIMRIPGGVNYKKSPPRPVLALSYGEKVDRDGFADFAVTPQTSNIVALPVSVAKLATLSTADGLDDLQEFCRGQARATAWVPDLTIADYQMFQLSCPKWDGTYNMTRRDPRMRDKSKSEFAFSLAGQAAWVNVFHYSKILMALVSFYRKHGIADKENRLDWFITTVRKAALTNPGDEAGILGVAKTAEIEDQLTSEIAGDAPVQQRESNSGNAKVAAIARVIGVPVDRFIKWGIEPVTFGLEVDRRQVELGTSKEVLSQPHWRQTLYSFGYMMKSQPKAAWDTILRELTTLWEPQPLGSVADKQLNLRHLIADLVLNQGMAVDTQQDRVKASKRGLPFSWNRRGDVSWWVPARIIRRLIEERDGKLPTNEHMARDMSKIGYVYERRNATSDGAVKAGYYRGPPLPSPETDPRAHALPYRGDDEEEEE